MNLSMESKIPESKISEVLSKVLDIRSKMVLYVILQALNRNSRKTVTAWDVIGEFYALNYPPPSLTEVVRIMNGLTEMDILTVVNRREKRYKLAFDKEELEKFTNDPELMEILRSLNK